MKAMEHEMTEELTWSNDWPTTKGIYWFYGRRWRRDHIKSNIVDVAKSGNDIWMYSTEACFLSKLEGAEGLWAPAVLPIPPIEVQERFNLFK